MKNGTSRRDFFKAAAAASLAGLSAEAAGQPSQPAAAAPPVAPPPPSSQAGFPRAFTGRNLSRISCPLGGIGTGGIGLGGRGNLQDWQIFNRPDTGNAPELSFPALWVGAPGRPPYATALERRFLPPFDTGENGFDNGQLAGLPRLAEAHFHSSFPISQIEFADSACPVHVVLEAFSPFQPLDAEASGLPCAILSYEVHNPTASPLEASIAWTIANPVGNSDKRRNQIVSANAIRGLLMTDPSLDAGDPLQGSFALAALSALGSSIQLLPNWPGGTIWSVGAQRFWFDNFSKSGKIGEPLEPSSPVASVAIRNSIPARATRTFRFLLAWHFPNRTPARCGWDALPGSEKIPVGNYYCTRFADAWAVAEHVALHLPELESRTRAFTSALLHSTIPAAVKDAAASNLTTLVSNTSFRIADGSFQGFEGCGDKSGLGFGTCTHVWNYEVATQLLFPSLARSMRETSFGPATDSEGHMNFRHYIPNNSTRWGAAAADGQMGQIVKLYFDWILSGDDNWLREYWPACKRALAYAWRPGGWDERKSGVMDGVQHNTCDIEYYGPNPLCTTWYLAALRASSQMANAVGDTQFAAQCAQMAAEGAQWVDRNLFNGEFYIQKVRGIPANNIAAGLIQGMGARDPMNPDFQVGPGCYADQLVGQYMATLAGLGDLLHPDHIRAALHSIYRYNLKRNLEDHASVQRAYSLNDEAALIVVDYSKGGRPQVPMPYYSENWTGMEHSVAALMISHGMVAEGIEIISNVRRRHDGERRNPFDETEYGRHYARAMSSWAAIPMLSGFHFNARSARLDIAPKINPGDFRCFWSTPSAWGLFSLTNGNLELSVTAGALALRELTITPFPAATKLQVALGNSPLKHRASTLSAGILLQFENSAAVDPARPLRVRA